MLPVYAREKGSVIKNKNNNSTFTFWVTIMVEIKVAYDPRV